MEKYPLMMKWFSQGGCPVGNNSQTRHARSLTPIPPLMEQLANPLMKQLSID